MSASVTCPHGHSVSLSAVATLAPAEKLACPVCGAAVSLTPPADNGSESATLPPASAEAPTLAPTAAPPLSERVAVPGYEILSELGRGGMGVVYKARHAGLNRVVALKMILAGGHAGPDELARFRGEAEAVARLKHPNVVQVYDVGESGGLPYFSLEFVEGGSLDRKLAGTPLPPKEAAALVETLARAMAAAHAAGLVHRDLKPANVLLTADGTPKVTDFGLVKKLDAVGQTASGAVMGTPSYMAPEQAGGKSKEIGPACDTYALGAILYECLTGRPPFKAATALDTILQVVSEEPVAPRLINAQVPADVETICLKCLQKEAGRRYESAAALADDLRRFVEGRPIVARPVGRWERATKWVRRNPVVAGAVAAVVLALLVGTGFSTGFGINASREADRARQNEETAKKNEADAIAARNDLAKKTDELETTLAHSLLRPLALQGGDKPMTDPEWDALWELATTRSGRLGYRFVEEASRTPVTSRQLRDRAALALPASVGLDAERRDEVEKLLLARLADPALGDEQKTDLALALWAWDGLSGPGAVGTVRQFVAAMTETTDAYVLKQLAQGLSAKAARLEPKEAAQVAAALTQAMQDTKNAGALRDLAQGLSSVAARLEPKDAAQAAAVLTQAMKDTKDAIAWSHLALGLSAVADRMEPKKAAAALTQAMKDTKDVRDLWQLVQGLSAVAARMEPEEAAQATAALIQAMKDNKNPFTLGQLVQGLSAVAARLEPKDAAQVAAVLTQAMKDAKDALALRDLAQGLSSVAARLKPKEVAQAAALLVQAMKDTKDENALHFLAQGLSAVATSMEPKEAAQATAQAAARLIQAMKDPKGALALQWLADGLSALAARMEAKEAARAAAQAADALTQAMKDTKNTFVLPQLARGLSVVAGRLESKEAAQAAAALTQIMKDNKNSPALYDLAQGLSAVAARMEPKEAAAALTQTMKDSNNAGLLPELAQGLSAVAARMEPKEAAAALTQTMKDVKDDVNALPYLARGLSAVAPRLEPKEAAAVLTQAMKDTKNARALPELAQGLSAVAARIAPKEAAAALTQAMKDNKDANALGQLALGLSAVVARLEPKEAAKATAALTQTMQDPKNAGAWPQLAQSLTAVAPDMEPNEAAQAAAALTQAMKDTKHAFVLAQLAQGLSAVATRMEPKEATAVTAPAVTILVHAMSDDKEAYILQGLVQGLSGLLSAVPPSELSSRTATAASAVAFPASTGQPLTALTLLIPATEPLPCRLSTQQLVELLKMPPYVGAARRVVLDHLGNRYKRPFADVWEFVRFAKEQRLDLDFTSPPQRPEETTAAAAKP